MSDDKTKSTCPECGWYAGDPLKPSGFTWEYRGLRGGWRSPPNPAVKYLERRLVGPVERVEDKPCD
jgi:hypothetical protein